MTTQTLDYKLPEKPSRFLGFGAHIWAGDAIGKAVVKDLKLRYVRVDVCPKWGDQTKEKPPLIGSVEDCLEYVKHNFDKGRLEKARELSTFAKEKSLKVILVLFGVPNAWFINITNVSPISALAHVAPFANLWYAILFYLNKYGFKPDYVELANEPDLDSDGKINHAVYPLLIKVVRSLLDDDQLGKKLSASLQWNVDVHALKKVGLIGPGLARMKTGKEWIDSLDNLGVPALAGWSTHTWDEADRNFDQDPQFFRTQWDSFREAVGTKAPKFDKPIIVTEYGTKTTKFGGENFRSPDHERGGRSASETWPFALRTLEHTLSLLNGGANALLIWEAADQIWHELSWGLATLYWKARLAYHALRPLYREAPAEAEVIPQTPQGGLSSVALRGEGRLVVTLVNSDLERKKRILKFHKNILVDESKAKVYSQGDPNSKGDGTKRDDTKRFNMPGAFKESVPTSYENGVVVTLEPQSTKTLVFELRGSPRSLFVQPGAGLVFELRGSPRSLFVQPGAGLVPEPPSSPKFPAADPKFPAAADVEGREMEFIDSLGACMDYTPPANKNARGASRKILFVLQSGDRIHVSRRSHWVARDITTKSEYDIVQGWVTRRQGQAVKDRREYWFWVVYAGKRHAQVVADADP
jgi:hypothetical protein